MYNHTRNCYELTDRGGSYAWIWEIFADIVDDTPFALSSLKTWIADNK